MTVNEKLLDLFGYSVKLSRLSEEDGGGWLAEVPELDGCISDGDTPHEALTNIQDAIRCWLESAEEHGKPIPPPEVHEEPEFSGKFTLRIPRLLHRFLARQAEREGVSLNQYIVSLISFNAGKKSAEDSSIPWGSRNDLERYDLCYTVVRLERLSPDSNWKNLKQLSLDDPLKSDEIVTNKYSCRRF